MNLLILKGFNNYFNRIIKRYTTLSDYTTNSEEYYYFSNINFNPNDGVTTTQIIGSENQKQSDGVDLVPLAWEHEGNPDYLIAYETEQVGGASTNVIKSRWFIVESVRTRNGQYSLKLKRDSIADNLDTLLFCPAFIKKGTVSDDNPLVVNSEGIVVNQIKSGETLLKDNTGSAWIVGYMAKNAPASTITSQIPDETFTNYETIEDLASELGVDTSDLATVLTENSSNPSYFVNDNIEIIGWINKVDATSLEWKIVGGSSNGLSSFSYNNYQVLSHSATSDCFAKESTTQQYTALFADKIAEYWLNALNTFKASIKSAWKSITNHPLFTKTIYEKLKALSTNKTVIFKNGKYYNIKFGAVLGPTNTGETYFSSALTSPFSSVCSATISDYNTWAASQLTARSLTALSGGKIFLTYNELTAYIYLEEVSVGDEVPGITVTMTSTRNAIMDQPYDMFAIPASNTKIVDNGNEYDVYGEYAQKAAIELVKELTSSNVYDVQLLPYCPIPEMAGDGEIDISNFTSGYDYDWLNYTGAYLEQFEGTDSNDSWFEVTAGLYRTGVSILTGASSYSDIDSWDCELNVSGLRYTITKTYMPDGGYIKLIVQIDQISLSQPTTEVIGHFWWTEKKTGTIHRSIIIYPKSNSFSVNLEYSLSLKDSMKIDSQTDLYRLVSPNYQGSFDFNVAKNGGEVNGFIADCTYKPYTPYIKVSPNFGWLYGTNYGDCRGLICGGDFSIGIINSAWEQYQLQNKNYQNIFNREIQNLDVNQSIQRTQQYVSGGLNIVRDTISGGVGGALATGSPYGAIAGAAVGGIGSGIGYGIDMNLMEKNLQEQRQFAIDKYKMQLGNIQALPYTLTKVGAFNINSKVFPFLEYYTCSEQEKQALKMKIQYEGMTIGVVDYLGNYMNNGYIQADLIRNEAIIEDSHQLDDIYIELTKGVYM
jgi:hypothetical protein